MEEPGKQAEIDHAWFVLCRDWIDVDWCHEIGGMTWVGSGDDSGEAWVINHLLDELSCLAAARNHSIHANGRREIGAARGCQQCRRAVVEKVSANFGPASVIMTMVRPADLGHQLQSRWIKLVILQHLISRSGSGRPCNDQVSGCDGLLAANLDASQVAIVEKWTY